MKLHFEKNHLLVNFLNPYSLEGSRSPPILGDFCVGSRESRRLSGRYPFT
jgi:hypothetical protein